MLTRRPANFAGFAACAGMIGYALYAQYVLYLDPCPLCLFQRFAIIALGAAFLAAALQNPKRWGAVLYASLIGAAAMTGIGIAAWHVHIQALPPGSVPSCGASLGYLFEIMSVVDVVKKVFSGSGECQHVDLLFGLSWPWWTIISLTVLGAFGVVANSKLKP